MAPSHVPKTVANEEKNMTRYLLIKPRNSNRGPIDTNGTPSSVDGTSSDDVAEWWRQERNISAAA